MRESNTTLLSAEERQQLLVGFNATEMAYSAEMQVQELFEQRVDEAPARVALVFGEEQMSYGDLEVRANRLAHTLRADHGVGPDVLVGICLERSLEMVVGIMGILKAGGAYVPLDPEYPVERLNFMLADSAARVVLTRGALPEGVTFDGTVLDLVREDAYAEDSSRLPRLGNSRNLAYVIYTSGSTGKPKGVLSEHRGLVSHLEWMKEYFGLDQHEVILQKTTYTFDVSVWELVLPLVIGAQEVLLGPGEEKEPEQIVRTIRQRAVTLLHFVPSMMEAYLRELPTNALSGVKRCICSGEALPRELCQRFFEATDGKVELFNLYGPTEASIDVTAWKAGEGTSIGKPVANTRIYILSTERNLIPLGMAGELCIGGVQVARGYLNRPELTAERFIEDPFSSEAAARLYRTGDLARWLPDGNLEYLGRMDDQVKIRGYRIELGEVENALRLVSGVREAVVVARDDKAGGKYLCGYFVGEADSLRMREELSKQLPSYMIPPHLMVLESFPLTPNGKINRKDLPEPKRRQSEQVYLAPQNELEKNIADIWREILKIDEVSIHDNFFELGGNSLLLLRVRSRLQEVLNRKITGVELFQYPTIQRFARYLDGGQEENFSEVVRTRTDRQRQLRERNRVIDRTRISRMNNADGQ